MCQKSELKLHFAFLKMSVYSKAKSSNPNKTEKSSSPASSSEASSRKTSQTKKVVRKNKSNSSPSSDEKTKKRTIPVKKESVAKPPSPKPASPKPTSPVMTASLGGFDEFVTIKTAATELRNSLPLDFTDTPMTPAELEKRYTKADFNVVGLNILLQDETKLTIPKTVRATLQTLFVTSSRLSGHIKLKDISALSGCKALRELSLSKCHLLEDIDPLSGLTNLEVVDLSHCSSLANIGNTFDNSRRLHSLNLSRCSKLKKVKLNNSSLKTLDLSYCESLTSYDRSLNPALEVLNLSHCTSLKEKDFSSDSKTVSCLKELNIHGSSLEKDYVCQTRQLGPLNVASWNLLARGLEIDGFLTVDGLPSVEWSSRKNKVTHILRNMLNTNDIVVTQENDNFFWLLTELQKTNPDVKGVWCCKTLPSEERPGDFVTSNARAFLIKRMATSLLNQMGEKKSEAKALIELGPKVFGPKCAELYNIVNSTNRDVRTFNTFDKEIPQYQSFSELYGLGSDDTFISDDGIGVYYDSNKVALRDIASRLFEKVGPEKCARYGMVDDVPILWHDDGWFDLDFDANNGNSVTVFAAHLPSGEDTKAEGKRLAIVKTMVSSIKEGDNCVFAMDSNVSPEYEASFEGTELASDYFRSSGYVDAIVPGTFPCFKMRGPGSDQPKKIGELFVDQIDKILYNPKVMVLLNREHPLNEYGFQRLSKHAYDRVYPIRINTKLRDENNTKVRAGGKTAVVADIYPDLNTPFVEIYPGPNAPSDHPPISATFAFGETDKRDIPATPRATLIDPKEEKKEAETPKEKTKREPSPEAPKPKKTESPKMKKVTLENLRSRFNEEIVAYYTIGRRDASLEPYTVEEIKEKVLDKRSKELDSMAKEMLKSFREGEDDDRIPEGDFFREELYDKGFFPDWEEEATKKTKKETSPRTKNVPKEESGSESEEKKWTVKSIRERLDELVIYHYTKGREKAGLRPNDEKKIRSQILKDEESSTELDQMAKSLFKASQKKEIKDKDFMNALYDSFLPDWKEEAKKSSKKK